MRHDRGPRQVKIGGFAFLLIRQEKPNKAHPKDKRQGKVLRLKVK